MTRLGVQSWMNTQNHFVFLQSCWLAQSYFAEHSNPTSHHPLRKKKKCISDCQEPSDSRKNTSFSGFVSHISSHDTFFFFFNAAEGPDFKGWVSHYLIPTWERKEDRAEVSWRDVFFSLSSTALYYLVSHPLNPLSADTPILAEKLPV